MVPEHHPVFALHPRGIGAEITLDFHQRLGRTGQAGDLGIEQRQIGRQLFRRVTLGIDSDEDGLQRGRVETAIPRLVERVGKQGECHRADIGAVGIAKEQCHRRPGEISSRSRRAGLVCQPEFLAGKIGNADLHLARLLFRQPENCARNGNKRHHSNSGKHHACGPCA